MIEICILQNLWVNTHAYCTAYIQPQFKFNPNLIVKGKCPNKGVYPVAEDCVTLVESSSVSLLNSEKGPVASTGGYGRNQEAPR